MGLLKKSCDSFSFNMSYYIYSSQQLFPLLFPEILATSKAEIEKREKFCLTEEQVLKLSQIGVYLEYCYGCPRDIEWAVFEVFSDIIYFRVHLKLISL